MTWGHLQNVSMEQRLFSGTGVGVGLCINGRAYIKGVIIEAGKSAFMIQRPAFYHRSKFIFWRWIVGGSADQKLSETLQVANDGPIRVSELTDRILITKWHRISFLVVP